jgi:hypothetical protein
MCFFKLLNYHCFYVHLRSGVELKP